MNELTTIWEQFSLFLSQHVPAGFLQQAGWVAVGTLVLGIGISVLGAKLARFAMTSAFVVGGFAAGFFFGQAFGYTSLLCGFVGAALIGAIGFLTFRLWVGVTAATLLCVVALGVFGQQRLLPHVGEFQQSMMAWSPTDGPVEFSVPTPEEQAALRDRTPEQWAEQFWSYVKLRDLDADRQVRVIGIVALLTGLLLGMVAVRATLIIGTSVVGTILVSTGVATLFARFVPDGYHAGFQHAGVVGIGVGSFLATSVILQTLVTRSARSRSEEPADAKA